jgi:hypothetical protein
MMTPFDPLERGPTMKSKLRQALGRYAAWPIAAAVLLLVIGGLALIWLGILWPDPLKPPL